MLTKDEVHERAKKIIHALPDHEFMDDIDEFVLELNKQASLAIDLAAEVERLKTKVQYLIEGTEEVNQANTELQAEVERLKSVMSQIRAWGKQYICGENEDEDEGIMDAQRSVLQILEQAEPPKGE